MAVSRRKPEVKSPAGHWPQLRAAIEAGADGVYFGLRHFTARAKTGFSLEELPKAVRTLHQRGVCGYVTFNTLIFEHELREAARVIAAIAEAGADGIIIQDWAAVKLVREIAPDLPIHGSTQMSITEPKGVELARHFGVDRVTLARELSLEEIRKITAESPCDIEIFVHGALCVAYSGQCYSSEAWGGRSANRGQCAQACRLPYELVVDGEVEPLGDARYLLSPGDLYALRQVPEMVEMGVGALKIEGRYKDAEYVALATHAYRKAVDEAWTQRELSVTKAEEQQLEQVYSRGLGAYFLTGTNHQSVVRGRAPRHRGVKAGTVTRVDAGRIWIQPEASIALKPGDGVVFDAADWRSPEEHEEGGRIFEVRSSGTHPKGKVKESELVFGNGAVRADRIHPGDWVWRSHDPEVERAARVYTNANAPVARQLVDVAVCAREGAPLRTEWTLAAHPDIVVTVASPEPLTVAQNRGITLETLRDQLGRLGNTAYELGSLKLDADATLFVPVSALNQLRRQAVERLMELQAMPQTIRVHDPLEVTARLIREDRKPESNASDPQLHLLVRTPEQLKAAMECAPSSITLDYLDLYGLRPSIEKVRSSGVAVRVASPRILKPGEVKIANFLVSLECPILVRSSGLLEMLRSGEPRELIGDFSLNVASSLAADIFLGLGLNRFTPTHDLNAAQVADLARCVGSERIEAIAYQHLPVFHTEHCVFCRFLSQGTSYRDCGRPCETHTVALKDASGREHPVMADVGCRNTVFGAQAQEVSGHFDEWRSAGIRHWRVEFAHETADEVAHIAEAFAKALSGQGNGRELAGALKKFAPQGTTEGSLYVAQNYRSLPILQ
ncbi:MAG: U32 family peptidase [Bryobacteraceae bacterium]